MIEVIIIAAGIIYGIGALVTLKADSCLKGSATPYGIWDLFIAVIFWVPVALLIITTKHKTTFNDYEY